MKPNSITLLLLLSAALGAQDSRPLEPQAALARARVIANQEQNPRGALTVLEELVLRPGLDATTKQAAEQEAARLRALLLPPDPKAAQAIADSRSIAAVGKLRRDDEAGWRGGMEDLAFLGDVAVPVLQASIEQEKLDRTFVLRATAVLVRIGTGKAAVAFEGLVDRGDDFRRRAMLEGAALDKEGLHTMAMRKAFASLFALHDPELAVAAIRKIRRQVLPDQLVELLGTRSYGDGSEEVRAAAGVALASVQPDASWLPVLPRFLEVLAGNLEHGDADVAEVLAQSPLFVNHGEARALLLRALAAGQELRARWRQTVSAQSVGTDESIDLVMAVVQAWTGKVATDAQKRILAPLVAAHAARWTKPHVGKICAALRFLGTMLPQPSTEVVTNLLRIAGPEDFAAVASVASLEPGRQDLHRWLERQPTLPEAAIPALRTLLENDLAAGMDVEGALLRLLAMTKRDVELEFLESLRVRFPKTVTWGVIEAVMAASEASSSPAGQRLLESYLTLPLTEAGPSAPMLRNMVFQRLVILGSQAAIPSYPKAYRLRLSATPADRSSSGAGLRGLEWLGFTRSAYSVADVERVADLLLASGHSGPWEDLPRFSGQTKPTPARIAIAEAALRHRAQSPGFPEGPARLIELASVVLGHGKKEVPTAWITLGELAADPALGNTIADVIMHLPEIPADARPVLEKLLAHDGLGHFALTSLAKLDGKGALELAILLLSDERPWVCEAAAAHLAVTDRARAVRELPRLAKSKAPQLRDAFAKLAGELSEEAFVPDLLPLLRDSNDFVRKSAAAALEKIRFVVEQTKFWARLQRGTGIDAPSAAEALLHKAKKDQPKPTRLLAIDSLGSLKVPETLPFLLELASDPDPEIAAHAVAAITKINGG